MGRFERYIGISPIKIGDAEMNIKPITGDIARFAKIAKLAEKEETVEDAIRQFVNFVVELVDRAEPLTEEDKNELRLLVELHLNEAIEEVARVFRLKVPEQSSFRKA